MKSFIYDIKQTVSEVELCNQFLWYQTTDVRNGIMQSFIYDIKQTVSEVELCIINFFDVKQLMSEMG